MTKSFWDAKITYMQKTMFDALINLLYPANCLICSQALKVDKNDHILCKTCSEKIIKTNPPFCLKCGLAAQSREDPNCPGCKNRIFHFDRAWSACSYEEPLKTLIHHFKYNSKLKLRKLFAKILAQFVDTYQLPLNDYDLLVSVPMHRARFREKEINHSQSIANELSSLYQIPVSTDNCLRIHQHALQSNLNFSQRLENVKGAFRVKTKEIFKDKALLIIDDVFTTGSTVSEVAQAIKDSGALRVDVLTLARTRPEKTKS